MTFSAELPGATFATAMRRAAQVAPDRATIPITQHALLRAANGRLQIAATNLDQSLAVTIESDAQGATTANASRLAAIAGHIDHETAVKLTADDTHLTVSQGRSRWRLPTLPADDYPTGLIEAPADATEVRCDGAALATALGHLGPACGDGAETRVYLQGVYFDCAPERLTLVATNGHRLGLDRLAEAAPQGAAAPYPIVPADALPPIVDIAKAGAVDVAMTAGQISIATDSVRVNSRLIDGAYPEYFRVIPAEPAFVITATTAELARAVARVGVVEPDSDGKKKRQRLTAVRLTAAPEAGELTVEARNAAGQEASDVVACRIDGKQTPPAVTIAGIYLEWAIQSLPGETVAIEIGKDGENPVLLRRQSDTDRASIRVIMPMRG